MIPARFYKYAVVCTLVCTLALLVSLAASSCRRESGPLVSPIREPLQIQSVLDDGYNVYWSGAREVHTELTPTLELVHQFRVVNANGAAIYTETLRADYQWHELEYVEAGALISFSYVWPSTPGQRQRRTFWRVDEETFDAFVELYGDELVCGPFMICVYEPGVDGHDGWYDAGYTGYRFYLPMVGGE